MMALMRKELREVLGIAVAALGCYLALVVSLMGTMAFYWVPGMPRGPEDVPFTSGDFTSIFTLISVVFAAALGFRQSAWESSRGTYLFLLHRPMRRTTIFLAKLTTGIAVFLLCSSVPIVLYAGWVSMPGHHAGPFEWSMTGSAWRLSFLMPLLYLALSSAACGRPAGSARACCRWPRRLPCWFWRTSCRGGGISVSLWRWCCTGCWRPMSVLWRGCAITPNQERNRS